MDRKTKRQTEKIAHEKTWIWLKERVRGELKGHKDIIIISKRKLIIYNKIVGVGQEET